MRISLNMWFVCQNKINYFTRTQKKLGHPFLLRGLMS